MDLETPLTNPHCPLCGGPNRCVPAQCGGFGQPCWCEGASFPKALLARVPEAARGKACVCADCARAQAATARRETTSCR